MKTIPSFPTQIETPENGTLYNIDDIRRFWRAIGVKYVVRWDTFFNGQTGMIYEGKFCVFDSDFKRFYNQSGISIG